jgi:hypothetical protein
MNPRYPILTAEQKTRKQAIRNWKRAHQNLVEYCKFATICQHVYDHQKKEEKRKVDAEMRSAFYNICFSVNDILLEDAKQDSLKYHSEVLAESVVDYLYK